MVELTLVHAAVLAVLVLLLLGLAAVNMMVTSQDSSTGYLSGGVVGGSSGENNAPHYQPADAPAARDLPGP